MSPSCPLVVLLSSVSVCVLGLGSDPVLLEQRNRCHSRLKQLQGQQVTVHTPPNITGHWVSDSCEVRPGPEFLTRSYRFLPDGRFQALQFFYQDPGCGEPRSSVLIRGRVRPLRGSWLVRGGTVGEVSVSGVQQRCLKTACEPPDPSMQELTLMRLELGAEELFLGDARRGPQQPAGYQTPLRSAQAERCGVCQLVSSADLHHPPVLPAQAERPVRLQGSWVSTRCEVRPGVLFLTRMLTFQEDSRSWTGQYDHFSDPVCRQPTFSITAGGHYSRGDPSSAIGGAVEFTFTVTQMAVTPMDVATTSLLNVFRGRGCGSEGSWQRGVPQDVTSTSGCAALGVRLPHTEYELFRAGQDPSGHSLLYNGQRPSDGSSPDRPERRPTSFQSPLIRCGSVPPGERRRGRERDLPFRLSAGGGAITPDTLVLALVLLHALM
ncbi:protein APCDD1-like [Puntigrus tetrazona]|uniref:protein APCDD1-like n=1 Tax=Puntigrus tetrazona TaxID=1606681 RepID=UPI001C89FBE6|nr:protein APCDD1-like [Puntigrus tetrazona]